MRSIISNINANNQQVADLSEMLSSADFGTYRFPMFTQLGSLGYLALHSALSIVVLLCNLPHLHARKLAKHSRTIPNIQHGPRYSRSSPFSPILRVTSVKDNVLSPFHEMNHE